MTKSNIVTLKKNFEFKYVYNKGRVFSNNLLILYIIENKKENNRVGFIVSKKVGKSVVRNKIRRRLKEIYRLNYNSIKKGYNLIIISRKSAVNTSYKDLEKSMQNLFKKSKILIDFIDER